MIEQETRFSLAVRRYAQLCGVLCLTLWPGLSAFAADGNELHAVGAVQQGMAGAGVATPQDSTWSMLNPASLVDLGRRVDFIHEFLFIEIEAHPQGAVIASNPFAGGMTDRSLILIPALGLVWPQERGTLGFGIFGLSGNRLDFNHPRSTLSLPKNGDRRSAYEVVRIPLSYAIPVTERLAIGGAIVPVATRFRTDSITLKLQPSAGGYHWDVAFGIGFEAALYYRAPAWSFGLTYTSPTWMQEYDKYEDDAMQFNVDLPQKLQAGIGLRPTKRWEIALDYKWINWTKTDLWGRTAVQGGLQWDDQHIVKGAVSWKANDRLTLRAGISQSSKPMPEESVFVNAISPAVAQTHLGAGFSYVVDNRSSLHFGLSHALHETMADNGKGGFFSFLGRGTEVGYQESAITLQYSLAF